MVVSGAPMEVRQLELFSAVVREGGFNKAAARLFISRSAISRKIRLLEEELGQQLLLRAANGITLTPAGESLLRHSRIVSQHLRTIRDEFAGTAALQHGQLSVGANLTDCLGALPPVLGKFRKEFPGIELRITASESKELVSQIKRGQIDLALLTKPPDDKDLRIIRLYQEELLLAVSRAHPWAKRRRIRAAELSNVPFIGLTRNAAARPIVEAVFQQLGVKLQTIMELSNFVVIRPLVEANLGVSILPISLIETRPKPKRLHGLRITEKRIYRERVLAHLESEFLPRPVTEMVRLLKRELKQV